MTQGPEYVTDVAYARTFVADLSPTRLRLVAALNGFPAPPAEGFDYCELGSAHGDTTATLAAANPSSRFVGVDLNRDHIASANRLATAGGLDNVRFLERDFSDLADESLPDFDFIGAHGVLSWVGPDKRKALIEFAAAKLKPGGLLYASYNALPGWASVEPLRRLILERAAGFPGTTLERARHGLEFAKRMSEAGAQYFVGNPAAKVMLATMEQMGLPYTVHEYFHAHWVPMYFAQVAAEMAERGLYFVGQLPLHLNFRDLAIPASLAEIFGPVNDRIAFEGLKDFALNEFFRCDVYVNGKVGRSESVARAYFDCTPFGLGEVPLQREVRLPHCTLHFTSAIFDALFPALMQGASTVVELAQRPELASFGVAGVRDGVMRMALACLLSPVLRPTRASPTPEAGPLRLPSAYNRAVLSQRLSSSTPLALASPVAGTGVSIPMLQAVAIRLLTEVEPKHWHECIRGLLQRQPFRLKVGDRVVDDEEKERVLLEEVEKFRVERLGRFVELEILASHA
jgi:SAM-dependent methyltransferase